MFYLYLVYGAVFVTAGVLLGFQARLPSIVPGRALGNRRSVGNAVDQAVATLAAKGMPDEVLPRCLTRTGVDAYQVTLGAS